MRITSRRPIRRRYALGRMASDTLATQQPSSHAARRRSTRPTGDRSASSIARWLSYLYSNNPIPSARVFLLHKMTGNDGDHRSSLTACDAWPAPRAPLITPHRLVTFRQDSTKVRTRLQSRHGHAAHRRRAQRHCTAPPWSVALRAHRYCWKWWLL